MGNISHGISQWIHPQGTYEAMTLIVRRRRWRASAAIEQRPVDLAGQFDVLEVAFATEVDAEPRAQALQVIGDPVYVLGAEGVGSDRDDEEAGARILLPGVEGGGVEGETGTAVDGEECGHERSVVGRGGWGV